MKTLLLLAVLAIFSAAPARAQWKENGLAVSLNNPAKTVNLSRAAVSGGSLVVSGTSYGGSIVSTYLLSPILSGTVTGNVVRTGTNTGGTYASPVITGVVTLSGTGTAPAITGTAVQWIVVTSGTSSYRLPLYQ